MDIESFIAQCVTIANERQSRRHDLIRRYSDDSVFQLDIDSLLAEMLENAKADVPTAIHGYMRSQSFNGLKDTAIVIELPNCAPIWQWYSNGLPIDTKWAVNLRGEGPISYAWYQRIEEGRWARYNVMTMNNETILDAVALARQVWCELNNVTN